jgi:hypothetical protein
MAQDDVVLFEEDFSTLGVRVIGGDYSPAGEYHVPAALSEDLRWRETVIHHSYARISHGNWQVVVENDGGWALEQTAQIEQYEALLAAGEPYWRDVRIETQIRPMVTQGWRAVVFRYRHARRFYAVAFAAGSVRVLRRDNDVDTMLGEASCALDPEVWSTVRIVCDGRAVTVFVNGREVLACADESPQFFAEGCIAFAATDVTRFRTLRVTAPAPAAAASAADQTREREATAAARARHPRAVLWKKIPTPRWGTDRNLRVGDINGDGRNEIVLAQRTFRMGSDNYASISSLAAYDLDGKLLWTHGQPSAEHKHTTCDLCFQIHDLDGDGRAEVWFCRDFELLVADGATGQIVRRMPLPRPPEHKTWLRPLHRILGDSLFFCDLAGAGRPETILLKDRYHNAWAYDKHLRDLWHFRGNVGHYPFARDLDGDGKDEILMGYHLLDYDGSEKWQLQAKEHGDNVAFVDLHDSGSNSGPVHTRCVVAGSDAGFYILDLDGRVLKHYPIGHAQSLCVANVLPERDGLEIVCNTFWGPAGITAVMDEAGNLLHEFEPMPYACLLQPVNWVPLQAGAQPADLMLLSTHPRQGGLIDGHGRRAVVFPDDGHPVLCSDARDLDGDGLDEILTWDHEAIWIYKADAVPGRGPQNYPRRNPWYNDSNYRAQISLPAAR